MKRILFFAFTAPLVFLLSCHKDPEMNPDNFILIDDVYYYPHQKGHIICDMFAPYFEGIKWENDSGNSVASVYVYNSCTNNRGVLSDSFAWVQVEYRTGNSSRYWYGRTKRLFEFGRDGNGNISIAFDHFKIWEDGDTSSASYRTVSGKCTCK